jgi:AcrR family transcriptional regulator
MSTRDAILDGALHVMRTRGLARTTTKEIARAAGFSEATLYKLFADKLELFLCVLTERLPRVGVVSDGVAALVGTETLAANLRTMVVEIGGFYEASMPIAMSLFSDVDLLDRQRAAVHARGAGPEVVVARVAEYLRGEQARGRVNAAAPVEGAAFALVGASMHHAFLACFNGEVGQANEGSDGAGKGPDAAEAVADGAFADRVVASVLPALLP